MRNVETISYDIDGLMQDCSCSIANALSHRQDPERPAKTY